jgi:uncharacterized protein (UPF0332 family)
MNETASLIEKARRYLRSARTRAFEKRQIGDYGHAFAISSQTAEQVLETAKDFVNAVSDWVQAQS